MNTTRLHEESIFLEALEFSDKRKRDALVADRCGDDVALRERITELLQLNDSDCILDRDARTAIGFDEDRTPMPEIGTTIGNYKLLQEIGAGGMGVVFMAQQNEPVQRLVAIKVIKLGMDTRNVIARFEAERQTLALMDHPYITQVFDAGATESGRPYFVMELVRGTAINKYCDEKKLTIRERLQLFIRACQAIQHAHEKGVIHRDIKPTNVLVTNHDGEAIPKIIDFGIAKATNNQLSDKTLFTHFGEMIGTPLYMSPEQAEMSEPDVDTRSDIYSLGVVMYELLTGDPPFADLKNSGFNKIRNAIKSSEPQLASTRISSLAETRKEISSNRSTDMRSLSRVVKGELDWILCRCLSKSRSQRYDSAGDLARDILRYLNGEPVEAAAPSLGSKAANYVRRNRTMVLTGGLIAIVLVSCALIATSFGLNTMRMAEQVQRWEKATQVALTDAEHNKERAVEAEKLLAKERVKSKNFVVYQTITAENFDAMLDFKFGEHSLSNMDSQSPNGFLSLDELNDFCAKYGNGQTRVAIHETQIPEPPAQEWPSGPNWTMNPEDLADNNSAVADCRTKSNKKNAECPLKSCDDKSCPDAKCPITKSQTASRKPKYRTGNKNIAIFDATEMLALEKLLLQRKNQNRGSLDHVVGTAVAKLGVLCAKQENWSEAEKSFRAAKLILDQTMEFDSPDLLRLRLWLSASMMAQDKYETAGEEIESISLDVECMLERLPSDVADMLGRLKTQARKVLGKEI